MFTFLRKRQALKAWRARFQIRDECFKSTRAVFLSSFEQKFPSRSVFRFHALFRGLAYATMFMITLGSASAYANVYNVSPRNVFYPLKRAVERVQIAFVSEDQKSQYHADLALRRLEEVVALNDPEFHQLETVLLTRDVRREVEQSLSHLPALPQKLISAPFTPDAAAALRDASVSVETEPLPVSAMSVVSMATTENVLATTSVSQSFLEETIREDTLSRSPAGDVAICDPLLKIFDQPMLGAQGVFDEHSPIREKFRSYCE